MSKITVIPTLEEHLDKITDIEAKSFSTPWSRNSFACGMVNKGVQSYFTAMADGEIAGYICLFHLFEEGELLNIAVSPEHRNCGIGQLLMEKMFQCLAEKNVSRITLEVRQSNHTAKRLYERNGFTPIAVRKNYYSSPTEDGIVMEKHL